MANPSARVRSVGKRYGRDAWALRGVTLELGAGGITALIGANGSGKSTLLRILAGAVAATEGDVELFGRAAAAFRGEELRRQVGLVGQDAALDPDMTADETLRFFAALYGVAAREAQRRIARLTAAFELEGIRGKRLAQVSGGQRQRVHLAVGLLQQPALLLFDEPTNGLDPAMRKAYWTLLRAFCGERREGAAPAVVVATHDLPDAAEHADAVAVLSRGALVAAGRPADLLAQTGAGSLGDAFAALTGETLAARGAPGAGRGRRGGRA